MSLTLRDALHLRNQLLATDDWPAAAHAYAAEHDAYYGRLHTLERWMAEVFWATGPGADERRARILPRTIAEPAGMPDLVGRGPESEGDAASWWALLEG